MGHYDNCREGYCAKCGAAPGNHYGGYCEFCHPVEAKRAKEAKTTKENRLIRLETKIKTHLERFPK